MSDQLADSAQRLFSQHVDKAVLKAAEAGQFPKALWDAVVEAGFTAALLPEEAGGFGASPAEALRLLQIAAEHTAPIPLAETMLAGWLLARAGLPVPEGVLTLAPVRRGERLELAREGNGWRLRGTASRVPWARDAAALAVLAAGPGGPMVACVVADGVVTAHDANVAGEPRDTVVLDQLLPDAAVAPVDLDAAGLHAAGAAVRTAQIAGALSRALSLSVGYAQTRVQFGRPIGKFQAIQQNLAVLAGQSAAAIAAADMAADALGKMDAGQLSPMLVGAAKARAGEAASIAAGLAHQSHGAIGFTQEYDLHYATRRLWSWRDEFGNEAEWNIVVGRAALAAGAEGLWPALTAA
ncbi:MAG: acyl-CoA dehydrogenase family protein [Acetobacteraceae bacterium]|nr:acyl-CoA dehydrogenase family protein [Acetobacteraceae bacterium]